MKLLLTFIMVFIANAQNNQSSNLEILYDQFDAFNAQDIEALTKNIHDEFIWFTVTVDKAIIETKGLVQFKDGMISYFKAIPSVKSQYQKVIQFKDKVSFIETVTWTKDGKSTSQSSLAVYQFKDNKIYRVWYY